MADLRASTTDPDATLMLTKHGADMGSHTHSGVDGGKARILLQVLVTPWEVMDNQPMFDLLWRVRFRWKVWPRQVTGDRKYGTEENIAGIEEATLRLAGLGPGLTPSGDDVLGGFAAIMALLSPQLSADSISRKHIASAIVAVAKPRTTKLSGVLLEFAARGEVSEQFGTLLLSLNLPTEEFETVQKAIDRVLAFGASSGGDILLGMLLGLRALEGEID